MAESKQKVVSVGKVSVKAVDGAEDEERRITFVASSNHEDRHYERVDVGSLRLPLKGGGDMLVSSIPEGGVSDMVDIPLMLNHSGDVRDVIGSVRKAFFRNGELIFECGLSSISEAQTMLTLLEEGHLSNAFSITMIDYDYNPDSETISNAEIIEASLVYRGANKEARLLAIKSLLGEEMPKAEKQVAEAEVAEQAEEAKDAATDEATETPKTGEKATESEVAAEEEKETEAEAEESGAEAENESKAEKADEETKVNKEKAMNKEIAMDQVEKVAMPVQATSMANEYLKTKEANHDFAKFIVENYGKSSAAVTKAWAEKMREKGITGDEIYPAAIEQTFFKTWQNEGGILSYLKPSTLLHGATYAFATKSKGQGHKKTEKKDDADFKTIRRDYKPLIAYMRMPVDLQDLIDDTTGELATLRTEMLADLLYSAIAEAVVLGDADGTTEGKKLFQDEVRGIYSMTADIESSGTEETYANAVATKIEHDETDEPFDKALKTLAALQGIGEKILVAPTGFLLSCQIDHNNNRDYKFAPGSDFNKLLNCTIFEFDWMNREDAKYELIAFNAGSFLFPSGNDMLRTAFDTSLNQDIMLLEKPVTGTLFGRKVCAGYAKAGDV